MIGRLLVYGGEGGIRTHGPVAQTAVFETARFGHSRTSPLEELLCSFGWFSHLIGCTPQWWDAPGVRIQHRSTGLAMVFVKHIQAIGSKADDLLHRGESIHRA